MMHLFGRIPFTQVEAHILTAQLPGWFKVALKLVGRYALDLPWLLRTRFGIGRRITTGAAGVARLRLSLKERDIPLWLNSPMKELITEGDRVVGRSEEHTSELQSR